MNVKLFIASALTFMLIGCGGSNIGSCCSGIKAGEIAKGTAKIVADSSGNVTNGKIEAKVSAGNNKAVTVLKINNVKCSGDGCTGNPICTNDDPCNVAVEQKATNCGKENMDPDLNLSPEVIAEAKEHYKDLAEGKVVVQGGKIVVTETSGQVTSCGLDVEIKLPAQWCGKEIGSGVSTGFAYPFQEGDKVEVLITNADGTKRWETAELRDGKIILTGLQDVTLPATFTLFRVTTYSEQTLTGITGVFTGGS